MSQSSDIEYFGDQNPALCSTVTSVRGTTHRHRSPRVSRQNTLLERARSRAKTDGFQRLLQSVPESRFTGWRDSINPRRTGRTQNHQSQPLLLAVSLPWAVSNADGGVGACSPGTGFATHFALSVKETPIATEYSRLITVRLFGPIERPCQHELEPCPQSIRIRHKRYFGPFTRTAGACRGSR